MTIKQYGKSLTWSTVDAPHPFGGIAEDYSYKDAFQETPIEGETDIQAFALHGRKGEISFNATATDASTDFLDLSGGVKLTISGLATGTVLATQAVETWALGQPKRLSLSATHYPDMTDAGGDAAGELSAATPTPPEGIIIRPAGKVIFSTAGLTHAAGIVQGLTLTQKIKLVDQEDELGKLIAAFVANYMRTIELDLISTAAAPALNTVLTIAGAPDHAAGYIITSADLNWRKGDKKSYKIGAIWAPCLAA